MGAVRGYVFLFLFPHDLIILALFLLDQSEGRAIKIKNGLLANLPLTDSISAWVRGKKIILIKTYFPVLQPQICLIRIFQSILFHMWPTEPQVHGGEFAVTREEMCKQGRPLCEVCICLKCSYSTAVLYLNIMAMQGAVSAPFISVTPTVSHLSRRFAPYLYGRLVSRQKLSLGRDNAGDHQRALSLVHAVI